MKLSLIEWIAVGAVIVLLLCIPSCLHSIKEVDQTFGRGNEITPDLIQKLQDDSYHLGYLQGALDALEGNAVHSRKDILKRRDSE